MVEIVENKFKEIFGTEGKFKTYFVPNKKNLLDTTKEKKIKKNNKPETSATVRKREDNIINFYSVNYEECGIMSFSLENLHYNENETWVKYPKSVVLDLKKSGYNINHGFDVVYYQKNTQGDAMELKLLTYIILNDIFKLNIENEKLIKISNETEENQEEKEISDVKLQIL